MMADLFSRGAATVVVLGDAMIDLYVTGDVDRISPEAPVPVLRHRGDRAVAGGAGNVAANVVSLGASAKLISVVGNDANGDQLGALLQGMGVAFEPVTVLGRTTSSKTRVMAGNQHFVRIDKEDASPITQEAEEAVLARVETALSKGRVLAISDYAKGLLTDRVLASAIALAQARGVPVLVDPKRSNFSAYVGASLIKPNRRELAAASGLSCASDDEVEQAARTMIEQTGASMMVTRSEKGISYFAQGTSAIHMPTEAKSVFDVSGAGDTVFATVACGVANELSIEQTMRLANIAAGIVVSKPGTATVGLDELRAAAAHHEAHAALRKGGLVSQAAAVAIRKHWRRQGLRVGFTNGCFDLLHPGHISILRGAARHCDRLIVGLNADSSVSRLKGASRPVQSELARAVVLGAVDCVDLVTIFNDDTPASLIEAILPDVLVKGADYAVEQIIGADIVLAAGGRVERVGLVPGQSTTELVRRAATNPTTTGTAATSRAATLIKRDRSVEASVAAK
jgi:D-beta-D-heptose 7-phosphate kinase/D-beta-D-heptose 1-phosphate adenosyltransferase